MARLIVCTPPAALVRSLILILLLNSAIAPINAEVLQTFGGEEQRHRSQAEAQERQRQLQKPNVDLQSTVPASESALSNAEEAALPAESPCFAIRQLILEVPGQLPPAMQAAGASALPLDPFRFAQDYLDRHAGACIGMRGLHKIVQRLTRLILARGYSTTRIGIPEQDLAGGTLKLTLVPGMIHAIRFADPALYGTWRNAFPAKAGDLLNLRDLEQGLEQMKRIPSQDVDMQIVPGDAPGQSDIVIGIRRAKPWKLFVNLDDSGAKGTGQWQSGLSFALDNPLGLSDMLNIGISTDADRRGTQRGTNGRSIYYAVPVGYWNFAVSASDYSYHQRIASYVDFVSSGKSRNLEFDIAHLFQRDRFQKNSWQFKLGKRWGNAYINTTEMDTQKRNTTSAQLAWMHKHYFGGAQLDITLANRWGVSWFDAQEDYKPRTPTSSTFRYSLQSIDATLVAPLRIANQPLTYIGTLRGQTTHSRLYLSDQFSIGNRYTVRGFDGELALSAERGFFIRNELDMPLMRSGQSAYAGIDFGKVYGPSVKDLLGNKLAGAALGLRGGWGGMRYDVFSSWPLYKPKELHTATPAIGIRLSYQY
ncbi:ShlB/FhaC/HecB family hemolysin secretion/activation protein [Oxalobacteraceae bacterium CAVE-383]|nr:ShlB/FhaC/HecB family hemolysin secretion/activation protein [Oxalobacteraceae bacterium CAVE-383]